MKKLLIFLMMSFVTLTSFAQEISLSVISTNGGVCCGQVILADLDGADHSVPVYYECSLIPSDQLGNPTGPPLYSNLQFGLLTQVAFQPWLYQANYCGQYYIVRIGIGPNNPFAYPFTPLTYYSSVIYYSPYPQPTITGSTITCSATLGILCVNGLINSEFVQSWQIAGPIFLGHQSCASVPGYYSGGLSVLVSNPYGCQSSTSVVITNQNNNPDFNVNTSSNCPGSCYTATASPVVSLPANMTESWYVEQADPSNNYAAVPGTGASNPTYWVGASVNFCGYVGAGGNLNTCNPSPGQFTNCKTYRLVRTVDGPDCPTAIKSKLVLICPQLRNASVIVEDEILSEIEIDRILQIKEKSDRSTGIQTASDEMSKIFPNPSTGVFNIQILQQDVGVLEVYNLLGNKIETLLLAGGISNYMLDLTAYAKGTYILHITTPDRTEIKRIVIQ